MKSPSFLLFRIMTRAAAVVVPCTVLLLLAFLMARGVPQLGTELFFGHVPPLDAILGRKAVWDGIWPACAGTFWLVLMTVLIAVLPGVGCGIWLAEAAPGRGRRFVGAGIEMLAGMPSIVMGLFGFMLILLLRRTLLPQANTCLLLAACCLALLVLPVLAASSREAMEAVPQDMRLAAAALGMSRGQAVLHLFLPLAVRGISGGVALAVGRAAEDTAVILFTGVVANAGLPAGPLHSFEALSFGIYYVSAQYQDADELLRGFGAAVVLLLVSCLMLALAGFLEAGFRRRFRGGPAGGTSGVLQRRAWRRS